MNTGLPQTGRWWAAALLPVPAIVVGAMIATHHGVSVLAFAPNGLAVVVGLLGLAVARHTAHDVVGRWPWLATLAVLLMGATLCMDDVDGVHRWLLLGPLRLHVSSVVLPWLVLALRTSSVVGFGLLLAAQVVHLLQPDAAQATALAVAAAPVLGGARRWWWRLVMLGLAALTWTRPDPLAPVPHVEDIFQLAIDAGPGWILAAVVSQALLLGPFVRAAMSSSAQSASWGWAGLFALLGALGASVVGHFPVAVLGAGAGPVLGWYGLLWMTMPSGPLPPTTTTTTTTTTTNNNDDKQQRRRQRRRR